MKNTTQPTTGTMPSTSTTLTDRLFALAYALLAITDIVILSTPEWLSYREISKPLILGSLIFYFLYKRFFFRDVKEWIFLGGLVFSFLGDGFLNYEGYFIQGLGCFFIAHVCYIFTFLQRKDLRNSISITHLLLLLAFAAGVFLMISDGLGSLKPYVMAYMLIIVLMVLSMISRKATVTAISYYTGLAGGLLFLISDTILAINKFGFAFFPADQLIMTTYALAQFLLVKAFLRD